ncbi:MAG: aldo/keto reductase [Chlamydiales bacterium]
MGSPVVIDPKNGTCHINGVQYPAVGFGTFRLKNEACTQAVKEAINAGYRIIDTATLYENFRAIARALKGQDRSHFYLISKVWPDRHLPENLRKDLDQTLEQLEIDYLDAYLLHWPNSKIPIGPTLNAMEQLRKEGKIRHIGLSNVTVNHLKRALEFKIPITWVQVEMHPNFCDFGLLEYCSKHAMTLQAWRPLDLGRAQANQMLEETGKKYKKTACQVALKWIIQHECVPLPSSKTKLHIEENSDISGFILSEEEMERIDKNAIKGERFCLAKERFGFTDEFDFSYEQCWPD